MSDTNVHRVVGNLLVGTSHFFVDTVNNQVGINTSSPSASLDIATGDLKVGSDITIGNSGTITAANFSGNGSGLSGINSDSGSWVKDDANGLVYVANSAHKVGVGTSSPGRLLEVYTGNGTVPGLRLRRGAGAAYTDLHHAAVNVPNTGDSEGLAIITSDGNQTTQEVMRICGNGNVGINQTSPYAKLDVNGFVKGGPGVTSRAPLHISDNTLDSTADATGVGNGKARFMMVHTPQDQYHGNEYGLEIGVTGSTGNSLLQSIGYIHSTGTTAAQYNLCLQPFGGNVGVGKHTAECRLDVDGELRVPSLEAQLTLSGGGDVTWTGSYVKWDHRVIILPADNEYYNTSGHINIPCPTSGTIPFYNGSDTITTKTCTASGIPLGAWEAVYYVISKSQSPGNSSHQTSINPNFIVVDYRSSHFKPQSNWILICLLNDDDKSLLWKPGQINITKGGVYSSSGGYVTKQNTYNTYSGTATGTGDWRSVTISESGIAHVHYHSLVRTGMRSGHTTTAVYAGLRRNSTNITDPVLGYRWATGSDSDSDRWRPINLSWSGKVAAGDVIKVVLSGNENNGAVFNGESFSVLVV